MQTFLPFPDFEKTARVLDFRRLGKQRVEGLQIYRLCKKSEQGIDLNSLPWGRHPCVKMWVGHSGFLGKYINTCISEWVRRGYKNTIQKFNESELSSPPKWFGDSEFHKRHIFNLWKKYPDYYGKTLELDSDRMKELLENQPQLFEYIWPEA